MGKRETSAGLLGVFYHVCMYWHFFNNQNILVKCDTTYRTGLRDNSCGLRNFQRPVSPGHAHSTLNKSGFETNKFRPEIIILRRGRKRPVQPLGFLNFTKVIFRSIKRLKLIESWFPEREARVLNWENKSYKLKRSVAAEYIQEEKDQGLGTTL